MPKTYWSLSLILARKPGTAMTSAGDKVEVLVGMYGSRDKAQADAARWECIHITPLIKQEIEYDCWPRDRFKFIDAFDNKE